MKRRFLALLCATVLCIMPFGAYATAPLYLNRLYDTASELLFDTENVTLEGTLVFSLNGERFKTAKAKYIQDSYNSLWDYRLFTPRYISQDTYPNPWGKPTPQPEETSQPDRETGFTIVHQNDGKHKYSDFYVREVIKPDVWRYGSREAQNSLVRRSARLEQLVTMIRPFLIQAECSSDIVALSATYDNDGTTYMIRLNGENTTYWINAAFSMCAQAVISRVIKPVNYDLLPYTPDYRYHLYETISDEIATLTESFNLRKAEISVTTDSENRLRSISGSLTIDLDMYNDPDHGYLTWLDDQLLDIEMEVRIFDYGTSHFEADNYGIQPPRH